MNSTSYQIWGIFLFCLCCEKAKENVSRTFRYATDFSYDNERVTYYNAVISFLHTINILAPDVNTNCK